MSTSNADLPSTHELANIVRDQLDSLDLEIDFDEITTVEGVMIQEDDEPRTARIPPGMLEELKERSRKA